MKVAVVQHDIVWEEAEATLARLAPQVERAAVAGARLVVLTEMFATGFSMATDRIAQDVDGPSSRFLAERAATLGVWVCGSISLRPEPGAKPVNRLVVAGPAGETAHYDKLHPFSYGGEHEHYAAGEKPVIVTIEGVRIGLSVCYDIRFADVYWAQAPDVDAYVVVANWPASRRHHWITLATARAIENQAYVIAADRVGDGGGLPQAGASRIIDPFGDTLVAADGAEAILLADVDPAVVTQVRNKFPFLADR